MIWRMSDNIFAVGIYGKEGKLLVWHFYGRNILREKYKDLCEIKKENKSDKIMLNRKRLYTKLYYEYVLEFSQWLND